MLDPVDWLKVIMTKKKESSKKAAVFLFTSCSLVSSNIKCVVSTKYQNMSCWMTTIVVVSFTSDAA